MRIVTILAAACQSRGLFIGARFHLGSGLVRSSGAPPVDAVATALQRVCPRLLEDPARFPQAALASGFDWHDFSGNGVRPVASAMGVSISESSGACVIGFAMELLSTQQFQRQWEVIRDLAFVTVPPSKTVTAPGENGIYGCSDAPPRIVLVTLSSAVEAPETLDYSGASFTRLGRAPAHAEVRVIVNKEDCGATEQRLGP